MPGKTLPWFTYSGVIDDLGQFLKKRVPRCYHDIVLLARKVSIKSDIYLNSTYHLAPIQLTIVCQTLEVEPKKKDVAGIAIIFENHVVDLSGQNAPDMLSFHETMEGDAWNGKTGCDGGSIAIHCQNKVGKGQLSINVCGGDGGKGQDGYIGQPGKKGRRGGNGEDGGKGARGGNGGDAGLLKIISLNCNPETIINTKACYANGGNGGLGGFKGKGGIGTPSSGRNGKDGDNGPNGEPGKVPNPDLAQVSSTVFHQSLPITACYLQRALNSEAVHSLYVKHHGKSKQVQQAKDNITWIKQMAEQYACEVIQDCCDKILEFLEQHPMPPRSPVSVKTAELNSHFSSLRAIVQKTTGIHSRQLLTNMQTDQIFSKRVKQAKLFNYLHSTHDQNLSRFNSSREIAKSLSNPPIDAQLESDLAVTSKSYILRHIAEAAKDRPYIKSALKLGEFSSSNASTYAESTALDFEESEASSFAPSEVQEFRAAKVFSETNLGPRDPFKPIDPVNPFKPPEPLKPFTPSTIPTSPGSTVLDTEEGTEFLEFSEAETALDSSEVLSEFLNGGELIGEGIVEGAGVAIEGAGVAVEGGVIAAMTPESIVFPPLLVVEAVVAAVVFAAVEIITALFEAHAAAIAKYEAAVRERVQLENQNRLRLQHDEKEPDPPEKRKQRKKERSESGKFVGVLDKCEPVEGGGGSFVVATFDCIHLDFTTDKEKEEMKVDLDDLDEFQEEELAAQLLSQRSPYSVLPAFIITATLPEQSRVTEKHLGRWFQFDAIFEGEGKSEAVEITPMISFGLGKLSRMASAVTGSSLPVTVSSVKALGDQLQDKVVTELGLFSDLSLEPSALGDLAPIVKQQLHLGKQPSSSGKGVQKPGSGSGSGGKDRSNQSGRKPEPSKKTIKPTIDRDKSKQKGHKRAEQNVVTEVLIANVYQASCNILYDESHNIKLVFDFGYGSRAFVNPDISVSLHHSPILVLSHWDLDHYRYLATDPGIAFGKTMIVPTFGSVRGVTVRRVSRSARDLARVYHSFGRGNSTAYQVINPPNCNLPTNVALCMTQLPGPVNGYQKNNVGAITACIGDLQNQPLLLMPGDASYSYVAPNQKVGLRHLVATHHGSTNSIVRDPNGVGSIPVAQNGTLYFSYREGNFYGHSMTGASPLYLPRGWTTMITTAQHIQGINVQLPLGQGDTDMTDGDTELSSALARLSV